jgi:hypothetical protein
MRWLGYSLIVFVVLATLWGIGVAFVGGVTSGFAVLSAIALAAGSIAVGRQIDQKRRGIPTIYEQQRQ